MTGAAASNQAAGTATARGFENRVDAAFRSHGRRSAALILYITAGHPNMETSLRLAPLIAGMADIVEIGIPFSDPVADGPIIQASSQTALALGTRVESCFDVAKAVREHTETPIVFLTYYNPVLQYGLEHFAASCSEASVDGIIGADLPPEEAGPLRSALDAVKIHFIPLVSPTSTDKRIVNASALAGGFVYCVSRTGVTGRRDALNSGLEGFLQRVRHSTDLPRAVGFGVSTPEQTKTVGSLAEGVIVGSALVDVITKARPSRLDSMVTRFIEPLREALDG